MMQFRNCIQWIRSSDLRIRPEFLSDRLDEFQMVPDQARTAP